MMMAICLAGRCRARPVPPGDQLQPGAAPRGRRVVRGRLPRRRHRAARLQAQEGKESRRQLCRRSVQVTARNYCAEGFRITQSLGFSVALQ